MIVPFLLALLAASINTYEARVVRVIDGDTIRVSIEIWHDQTVITSIRVRGIDTPELKGKCAEEQALAKIARDLMSALLPVGALVRLTNVKPDKFGGRYDADIQTPAGDLAKVLIEAGVARPYKGEKRLGWCP